MTPPRFVMRYRAEYGIGTLLRRNPHRVLARIVRRSWWLGKTMILEPLAQRSWIDDRDVDLVPPGDDAGGENLLQKDDLLEQCAAPRRGVLHVGAHDGQELEQYLSLGFRHILFFECDPVVFERLQAHVAFWQQWLDILEGRYGLREPPVLGALPRALGERRERASFFATSVDQQSSLLPPTGVVGGVERSFEVEVERLDDVLASEGLSPEDFNYLVIDVQGGELAVLKGARELLPNLDAIVSEVAFERRYEGQPSIEELDDFLESRGFIRSATRRWSPNDPSGDALYSRADQQRG